jgi:hypothetical protein
MKEGERGDRGRDGERRAKAERTKTKRSDGEGANWVGGKQIHAANSIKENGMFLVLPLMQPTPFAYYCHLWCHHWSSSF